MVPNIVPDNMKSPISRQGFCFNGLNMEQTHAICGIFTIQVPDSINLSFLDSFTETMMETTQP
jgi:hypothetical protein